MCDRWVNNNYSITRWATTDVREVKAGPGRAHLPAMPFFVAEDLSNGSECSLQLHLEVAVTKPIHFNSGR